MAGALARRTRRRSAARPSRPRAQRRTRAEHRLVELQRAAGNTAVSGMLVMRHPVAGTAVHRHTKADLFDPPGTSLAEFVSSLGVQADWFAEPSLTAADRTDLHALLVREQGGPHVQAGVGDIKLADLRGVAAADWTALEEYGRGRRNAGETVRMIDPAARSLADRIAIGRTLIALKAVISPQTLASSVSEAQLLDVHANAGLIPALAAYFAAFAPNLEMTYEPSAGARPLEFQNMLDLLRGPGIAPVRHSSRPGARPAPFPAGDADQSRAQLRRHLSSSTRAPHPARVPRRRRRVPAEREPVREPGRRPTESASHARRPGHHRGPDRCGARHRRHVRPAGCLGHAPGRPGDDRRTRRVAVGRPGAERRDEPRPGQREAEEGHRGSAQCADGEHGPGHRAGRVRRVPGRFDPGARRDARRRDRRPPRWAPQPGHRDRQTRRPPTASPGAAPRERARRWRWARRVP